MPFKIKLWGVLGTMPGGTKETKQLSTNTSCIVLSNDKEVFIFDAGSGLMQYSVTEYDSKNLPVIRIFLSHYHMDHIIGLLHSKFFFIENQKIEIYGPIINDLNCEDVFEKLYSKPFSPIDTSILKANISFHNLKPKDKLVFNKTTISTIQSDHFEGSICFSFENCNKFSYLSDLNHCDKNDKELIEFAYNSKYIYYDAHFIDKELNNNYLSTYGHSTIEKGIKLRTDSKSQFILLGHHSPYRKMDELEFKFSEKDILAKEYMEFLL